MKKTDIKEGQTYQNESGRAARRVIAIVNERTDLPRGGVGWRFTEGPWVRYMKERGPEKGGESVLTLESFARWARSEDAGTPESRVDLARRVEELEAALKPFANLSKAEPRKNGTIYEICGPDGAPCIRWEHLHAAAKLLEKTQ